MQSMLEQPRNVHDSLCLVEEPEDLARDVLSPRLLVIHDASGCSENDVAELTRGKQLRDPLLEVLDLDVVAWADDAGLVDAGSKSQQI